jgi:hypothetical protein
VLDIRSESEAIGNQEMAHSRRSRISTSLELALVAAGLFLLLEMSTRVLLFGFAGLLPSRVNSIRGLPQTGFTRPSPMDSGLVFELKPNVDGYFKLVPFRTNSRGLRDREYSVQKPENTFRVAVLGSSFALPAGVAIEDAFHSLLEEWFADELAPKRCEFINFAVGMYNPRHVLAMLETRALAYEPDLILFTATKLSMPMLANRPEPKTGDRGDESKALARETFQKSYPALRSFFLRLLLQRMGFFQDTRQTHVGVLERLFMTAVRPWTSSGWDVEAPKPETGTPRPRSAIGTDDRRRHDPVLERLAGIRERTGTPIVIVRLEIDASEKLPIDLEVERRSRALGLFYLDTRDAFAGTRPSDFWIFELDPHPNARAHEIFARVIASFLRSSNLLPPQTRR